MVMDVDAIQRASAAVTGDVSYSAGAQILQTLPNMDGKLSPSSKVMLDECYKVRNDSQAQKAILTNKLVELKDCMTALEFGKTEGTYVIAFLVELARNDVSVYDLYVRAFANLDLMKICSNFITTKGDPGSYAVDKCAYLLTALIVYDQSRSFHRHMPTVLSNIVGTWPLSDAGRVDAISNLLKLHEFRGTVWNTPKVANVVLSPTVDSSPPVLYKAVFCIWMMSFSPEVELDGARVMRFLKSIVLSCRVEKIIRVALEAIKNFLKTKGMCESVVEVDAFQAVSSLEYEKWRDASMYEEIRDVANSLDAATNEHTVFERYEKELGTGQLKFSFIHSEKFFLENVLKFDKDDFAAVKNVIKCLASHDPETLSVACHDIGEFARLHPSGKVVLNRFNAKAPVMLLMAHENREVAREALLCVQKLMLGKYNNLQQ